MINTKLKPVMPKFLLSSLLLLLVCVRADAKINHIIPYHGECYSEDIQVSETKTLFYQLTIKLKWLSLLKSIELKEFAFDTSIANREDLKIRDFKSDIDLDCERISEKASIYCEPVGSDSRIEYINILSTSEALIKMKSQEDEKVFGRCKRIAPNLEDEDLFDQAK